MYQMMDWVHSDALEFYQVFYDWVLLNMNSLAAWSSEKAGYKSFK